MLIAGVAAWAVSRLLQLLSGKPSTPPVSRTTVAPSNVEPARRAWRWLLPAAAAIGVVAWLAGFPVQPVLLGVGLMAATALVAWRPVLLFVLAPAALPVLDLAPWSGRRSLDEFDMLLGLGLTVAWARVPRPSATRYPAVAGMALAFALVLVSLGVATARALWPGIAPDADAFSNPMNPFNAVRLVKAGAEALALWMLARRLRAAGADPTAAFGLGMVLGLAGTVICVLAERLSFSYLLDFASDYRVAGPFSVMSLGGAYVECFLAVATPFLLVRLLPPLTPGRFLAGAVFLVAASYALMVTYSRGGYVAMVVGVVVLLAVALVPARQRAQHVAVGVALAALAAAVAYPILTGTFAQSRLQTVSADLGTRERHWAESLQAMGDDVPTRLFGAGLGRFPEIYFWRSPQGERAGGHRLVADGDGGTALRLGVGYAYFVDQIVPVRPGSRYRLSYSVRQDGRGAALAVALCQKWIIASFECTHGTAAKGEPSPAMSSQGTWQAVTFGIAAPGVGPGRLPRPVRLTLINEGRVPVDVDRLSLIGDDGVDLIRNGDFSSGLDRWTFTSDNHLAWHTKSLPLSIYFEQGLFGVIGLIVLLLAGAWHAVRAARWGWSDGAAFLAALCAFATVGLIDTLLDAPRFLLLWLLLCVLPATYVPRGSLDARPSNRA